MIPSVVMDSNVLLSGFHSRTGASFALLRALYSDQVKLHLSVPVVLEYRDVLLRDPARSGLSAADVETAVNSLCAIGDLHDIHYTWRPTLPDPGDEIFLELAVTARCPVIVTHNLRDYKGSVAFGIRAITPIEYLRMIGVVS